MIILALQLSPHDVHAGVELCQLIADLEPTYREDPFWIVYRKDTPPSLLNVASNYLLPKFPNTKLLKARNHGTGHPHGCNMLWSSTMVEAGAYSKSSGVVSRKSGKSLADGIFTFEADCVPMKLDWIKELNHEWDSRDRDTLVVGNRCSTGEMLEHINGNAIFSPDLLFRYPEMRGAPQNSAWDLHHRRTLTAIAQDTPSITQIYQKPTITKYELQAIRKDDRVPAILHGIKDDSARRGMRSILLEGWTSDIRIAPIRTGYLEIDAASD